MARFDCDGVLLDYDDDGSGPPIVLLHGLSLSRRTWDRFLPDLERQYRVVRLDQRGHGTSSHAGSYVLDSYLDDTVTFSQCFKFIALLPTDRSKNSFPRNLSFRLLTKFLELLQSDVVQPIHFLESSLQRQMFLHDRMTPEV
jgi:hypothetical protein